MAGRRGLFCNQKKKKKKSWRPLFPRRGAWETSALPPRPGQEGGPWLGTQGLRWHFPRFSRELPTPWWWEPWPSWTSAWRSCSPSSSPEAPAWPSSGFGGRLFTPLTCLFSFSLLGCFSSYLSLLPFLSSCLLSFCFLLFLSCSPFRFSHLFWLRLPPFSPHPFFL